jgi:hypothetical protein
VRACAVFSSADLERVSALAVAAWRAGVDRDWSAKAGTLAWTCTKTADHAVDTVLAPAFFLASRKLDGYPSFGPFTVGPDARPADLIEGLETATRILVAVIATAEPSARAVIRRRPRVQVAGPAEPNRRRRCLTQITA